MVQALEGQEIVEKEVHHLGKRKSISTFLVTICTADISSESNSTDKLEVYGFDK